MIPTLNRKKFSMMVEEYVRDHQVGYLEAIIQICEDMNIEGPDAAPFLTNIVKSKLEAEAIQLKYIKGGNSLPV